jgi:hypothetical protein
LIHSYEDLAAPQQTLPESDQEPSISSTQVQLRELTQNTIHTAASAPDLSVPSFASTYLEVPGLDSVELKTFESVDLQGLDLTLDFRDLDSTIESFQNVVATSPSFSNYERSIPELYSVVERMLQGDLIVNTAALGRVVRDPIDVAGAFIVRGLTPPPGTEQFDSLANEKLEGFVSEADEVFLARALDDNSTEAIQFGVTVDKLLFDLEFGLHDASFKRHLAGMEANLELAKSKAALYNAELIKFQGALAEYKAYIAAVRADSVRVDLEVKNSELGARLNQQISGVFQATERAKAASVGVYRASAMAEEAKLQGYEALMQSYAGKVAEAQAKVLQYSGKTQMYAAEVERIKNVYALYEAKADSVVSSNRAAVASVSAVQTRLQAIASRASLESAKAAAEATAVSVQNAAREASYESTNSKNLVQGATARIGASNYSEMVKGYVNGLSTGSVTFAQVSANHEAQRRFADTALDSAFRAATITQSANESLARAYASVYEAAGKAGAAVSSGKLSGFRASASLSATGSVGAGWNRGYSHTSSSAISHSESDNKSSTLSN